jgi:hypothetical protein
MGWFPSLKNLQIHQFIGDRFASFLEAVADTNRGPEGKHLESIAIYDISPYVLTYMSENDYFHNARVIRFFMSPMTEENEDAIFHNTSRESYVTALATFIQSCAEDCDIIGMTSLAAELLEEARRLNEEESGVEAV